MCRLLADRLRNRHRPGTQGRRGSPPPCSGGAASPARLKSLAAVLSAAGNSEPLNKLAPPSPAVPADKKLGGKCWQTPCRQRRPPFPSCFQSGKVPRLHHRVGAVVLHVHGVVLRALGEPVPVAVPAAFYPGKLNGTPARWPQSSQPGIVSREATLTVQLDHAPELAVGRRLGPLPGTVQGDQGAEAHGPVLPQWRTGTRSPSSAVLARPTRTAWPWS